VFAVAVQLLVQDFLTPLDLDDRMLADAERMCDWAIASESRVCV
jgi:hypothetical protein